MLQPVDSWDHAHYSSSSRDLFPIECHRLRVPSVSSVNEQKEIVLTIGGHKIRLDVSKRSLERALRVIDNFEKLASLNDNWDSYGSKRIKPEALIAALSFLVPIITQAPVPRISLTRSGGVLLVYTRAETDIEIEIDGFGAREAFLIDKKSGDSEEIEDITNNEIINLLEQ